MNFTTFAARYGKLIAALVGAVTEGINLGIVPSSAQNYVTVILTVLTTLGVYAVPNGPTAAQAAVNDALDEHKTTINENAALIDSNGETLAQLERDVAELKAAAQPASAVATGSTPSAGVTPDVAPQPAAPAAEPVVAEQSAPAETTADSVEPPSMPDPIADPLGALKFVAAG
jgi:hypothetical protein